MIKMDKYVSKGALSQRRTLKGNTVDVVLAAAHGGWSGTVWVRRAVDPQNYRLQKQVS